MSLACDAGHATCFALLLSPLRLNAEDLAFTALLHVADAQMTNHIGKHCLEADQATCIKRTDCCHQQ
jgi:hypothetical protein